MVLSHNWVVDHVPIPPIVEQFRKFPFLQSSLDWMATSIRLITFIMSSLYSLAWLTRVLTLPSMYRDWVTLNKKWCKLLADVDISTCPRIRILLIFGSPKSNTLEKLEHQYIQINDTRILIFFCRRLKYNYRVGDMDLSPTIMFSSCPVLYVGSTKYNLGS